MFQNLVFNIFKTEPGRSRDDFNDFPRNNLKIFLETHQKTYKETWISFLEVSIFIFTENRYMNQKNTCILCIQQELPADTQSTYDFIKQHVTTELLLEFRIILNNIYRERISEGKKFKYLNIL